MLCIKFHIIAWNNSQKFMKIYTSYSNHITFEMSEVFLNTIDLDRKKTQVLVSNLSNHWIFKCLKFYYLENNSQKLKIILVFLNELIKQKSFEVLSSSLIAWIGSQKVSYQGSQSLKL